MTTTSNEAEMSPQTPQRLSRKPSISYWGLYKARLANFAFRWCREYPDLVESVWAAYPTNHFVEALFYEADEEIEEGANGLRPFAELTPWTTRETFLVALLKELQLHSPAIETYIKKLGEYYELENQLMVSGPVTHAFVMQAMENLVSDMHVLRLLRRLQLGQDSGGEDTEFPIIHCINLLCDLHHHLYDYANDVANDHFNCYRMFIKLYGVDAPRHMQAEVVRWETRFEDSLAALPPAQQHLYQKRLKRRLRVVYETKLGTPPVNDQFTVFPEPLPETKGVKAQQNPSKAPLPSSVSRQAHLSHWSLQAAVPSLRWLDAILHPHYGSPDRNNYYPLLLFLNALVAEADTGPSTWTAAKEIFLALLDERQLAHPLLEAELDKVDTYYEVASSLLVGNSLPRADLLRAAESRAAVSTVTHMALRMALGVSIHPEDPAFALLWPYQVWRVLDQARQSSAEDSAQQRFSLYHQLERLPGPKVEANAEAGGAQQAMVTYAEVFQARSRGLSAAQQADYGDLSRAVATLFQP